MEMRGSAQGATGLYTIYSAARAPVPILKVAGPAHAHGVDAHPQCLFPLPAPPIALLFRLHPSLLAPPITLFSTRQLTLYSAGPGQFHERNDKRPQQQQL